MKIQSILVGIFAVVAVCAAAQYHRETRQVDHLRDAPAVGGHIVRVYDVHRLLLIGMPKSNYVPPVTFEDFVETSSLPAPAVLPEDIESHYGVQLLDMITSDVLPGTWKRNGGEIGSIRYAPGMLIVEQTARGQQKVADYLHSLDKQN